MRLNFPNLAGVVDIGSDSSKTATETSEFLVKTAQIPASSVGTIEVPYRGRMLKVAGDRTFEPWSVTVVNDGDFNIRKAFEKWSRGINAHAENVAQLGYGADGGESYCRDMTVYQLSVMESILPKHLRTLKFQGLMVWMLSVHIVSTIHGIRNLCNRSFLRIE